MIHRTICIVAWVIRDKSDRIYQWTISTRRRQSISFFMDEQTQEKWQHFHRRGYRCVRLLCKEWGST